MGAGPGPRHAARLKRVGCVSRGHSWRSGFFTIAIVIASVFAWSTTGSVGPRAPPRSASESDSGLVSDLSTIAITPSIAQVFNFTITGTTSGDSGAYEVTPADTLVVFVELFGRTTVHSVSIEDGPNDTFIQQAYQLQYANGGTHGLAVWTCTNVDGGPYTNVNVTLTGGSANSAAIEVIDVNGGNPYGGNPIPFVDQVSDTVYGVNRYPNEHLTVHADDLALAGIGTWSWNNFTAQSPAALGDQVTTNSSNGGANVTAGVLYYTNYNSSQKSVWMNATLSSSAPWIECIITLGALEYTQTYSVTFTETGLPSGTVWCEGLIGLNSSMVCGTSSLTLYVINGTYAWNVSVVSNLTWVDQVLGEAGNLIVGGRSVQLVFDFTDACSARCVQHVVVIVLENEPSSLITPTNAPYQSYLHKNYEGSTHFYGTCHPSDPNYLAIVSATTDQCGTDLYPGSSGSGAPPNGTGTYGSWENITLADLLQNHSKYVGGNDFSWGVYAEDLPLLTGSSKTNACTDPAYYDKLGTGGNTGNSGYSLFFSKHTGFLYENDVVHNTSFCEQSFHDLEPANKYDTTSTSFDQTVVNNTMSNFSLVVPNACSDGHNYCWGHPGEATTGPNATCFNNPCNATTTIGSRTVLKHQVDPWLQGFLGNLINCTGPYSRSVSITGNQHCEYEMNHTAFFVLYDEGSSSDTTGLTTSQVAHYANPRYANQNFQYCLNHGPTKGKYLTCGGSEYFTIVMRASSGLAKGHGSSYLTNYTSQYAIVDLVEWLFHLTNFSDVHSLHNNGLGKSNNPGWLDGLFEADHDYFWPGKVFSFKTNGY